MHLELDGHCLASVLGFGHPSELERLDVTRNRSDDVGCGLSDADDVIFRRTNSKQGDGIVGILTSGAVDRTEYYAPAMMLALIPFANAKIY